MNRGASSEPDGLNGNPATVTTATDDRLSGWVKIEG